MHLSMVLSLWKEDSVAEHWGQGGSCLIHVSHLDTTAKGEWFCGGGQPCQESQQAPGPSWLHTHTLGTLSL